VRAFLAVYKESNFIKSCGETVKYIVKKLSDDFLFDELEQVRKNFVNALTYTMESAEVFFKKDSADPLDIYIKYDFQQKQSSDVIHGFNFRDEIARNFKLDVNKQHSSEQLLVISEHLRRLANEIDKCYVVEATPSALETKDKKETDYAKSVNRSYKQILKDAKEEDERIRQAQLKRQSKEFIDAEFQLNNDINQTK